MLNPDLPVVNVGNRENPSYLPAEVCDVLPAQTIKRRLSPDQSQKMIEFACRKPYENAQHIITDGRAILGLDQNDNPILVSSAKCPFLIRILTFQSPLLASSLFQA